MRRRMGSSPTWLMVGLCIVIMLAEVPLSSACGRGAIYLQNNEYHQILVAIADTVPESTQLIDRIKEVFTDTSATLFQATRRRAYFGDITILVPKTWNGSYEPAIKESFDNSDIVIDRPDPTRPDDHRPFVIKTTPCGEPGYYMHMTPEYLHNPTAELGPIDKVLVHEWAHLRYGVYKEYPTEDPSDRYYYSASSGRLEAIRCSAAIQGEWVDGSGNLCYEQASNCRFQTNSAGARHYGSLMFAQNLPMVSQFCDNDEKTPATLHNREAPNQQNRLCGGRSVWEVLRSHDDFADANPSTDMDQRPIFRVVQAPRMKRTVLLLDTSGSMGGDRIIRQNQGCSNYLASIVQDGEKIGIVHFAAVAETLAPMTEVNDETRDGLVAKLPKKANGGTSIGNGLQQALRVLNADTGSSGAAIILVSDGENRDGLDVDDVWDEVIEANVTLHVIAFTQDADNRMGALAAATRGLSFLYPDSDNSNALNEAFQSIGALNLIPMEQSFTISSEAESLSKDGELFRQVIVDAGLGRDTEFIFDFADELQVDLWSPSGQHFSASSKECEDEVTFKIVRCKFNGLSEIGQWNFTATNTASTAQRLSVTVKSKSSSNTEYPIIAQVFWSLNNMTLKSGAVNPVQRIFASVSKGYTAVLGAVVTAVVETPATNYNYEKMTLLDNGAGADALQNDGVYSAYYTKIVGDGRYSVKVMVNSGKATIINPQYVVGRGPAASWKSPTNRLYQDASSVTGDFQRLANGGAISVKGYTDTMGKLYPPGPIRDLRVAGKDLISVDLTWTATGEQLDSGTASYYIILQSRSPTMTPNNSISIPQERVTNGANLSAPLPAQLTELFQIEPVQNDTSGNEGPGTFFYAVVAYDVEERAEPADSGLSNVVGVSLKVSSENPPDTSNKAWIIGVVVGIIVPCIIIVLVVVLIVKHRKNKTDPHDASTLYQVQSGKIETMGI